MDYENHLHNTEPRWFAVYTRFRREKVIARLLEQKGIECYLPLQRFTRRYTRKVRQVELPLFSCYIFVKITKAAYVPVLETENVVCFVKFKKNLLSIPEWEINLVRRIVGENIELEVEQTNWQLGDSVEMIAGNLTGLQGKLIQEKGKGNFLVELERMGYILRMQIDPALLRKIRTLTAH